MPVLGFGSSSSGKHVSQADLGLKNVKNPINDYSIGAYAWFLLS